MADTIKVLAQAYPAAQTLTAAYVLPTLTHATISSLTICNRSSAHDHFRVAVAVAGAADTPKQYIYYDTRVEGNDTFIATIGGTLGPTDVLRVYSKLGTSSFNVFGVESTT